MSQNSKRLKLPPQAIDFEEAVLGAILIDKNAMAEVGDILSPEVFYKESHKEIFKATETLFQNAEPIDVMTVKNQLQLNKKLKLCGGAIYLAELTNKVISSANIEYHSRIIVQKHIQRELISTCSEIIQVFGQLLGTKIFLNYSMRKSIHTAIERTFVWPYNCLEQQWLGFQQQFFCRNI